MIRGDEPNLILVIDGNPLLRVLTGYGLESLGWQALLAADVASGTEMFRKRGDRIAAVVLDLQTAAGADEHRVLRDLRSLRRDVPLIVCGNDASAARRSSPAPRDADRLPTPFSFDELGQVLQRAVRRCAFDGSGAVAEG
jgi:DNA-binding NtrC family response regulator